LERLIVEFPVAMDYTRRQTTIQFGRPDVGGVDGAIVTDV
jgi:hypothetical protein